MKRIKTGIEGLDELIDGGFPAGSAILLTGVAGTGKSILAGNYLYEGARMGETGVYVTFEESPDEVLAQWRQFFSGVDELIEKSFIKVMAPNTMREVMENMKETRKAVEGIKASRLVIDSLTTVAVYSSIPEVFMKRFCSNFDLDEPPQVSDASMRAVIKDLVGHIKSWKCTSLLISESREDGAGGDSIAEFSCDGIIKLGHLMGRTSRRTLVVEKMRQTWIDDRVYEMGIVEGGIVIRKLDDNIRTGEGNQ